MRTFLTKKTCSNFFKLQKLNINLVLFFMRNIEVSSLIPLIWILRRCLQWRFIFLCLYPSFFLHIEICNYFNDAFKETEALAFFVYIKLVLGWQLKILSGQEKWLFSLNLNTQKTKMAWKKPEGHGNDLSLHVY